MAESLGLRLRLERVRQGRKQKDLAREAGLSATALWDIEHDRTMPTSVHLLALAEALGVSMDWLAGRDEQRTKAMPT